VKNFTDLDAASDKFLSRSFNIGND